MIAETRRLTFCDGLITGLGATGGPDDQPLLVMIPGGGGNAAQFDVPGRSYLVNATLNGFSSIALNRPGQADSAPLPLDPSADSGAFAANADRLLSAIDEIWTSSGSRHSGILLYGSSIGGAIALHMAAKWSTSKRDWPLLGVAIADIGQVPPPALVKTWHALPADQIVNLADYFSVFFAGIPPWAVPRGPPLQAPPGPLVLPVPRAELQEVVGGWLREWKTICGQVSVPVQYSIAQHDTAWLVGDKAMREFTDALSKSPYVEASIVAGAIHVISNGPVGMSHLFQILSFASRCAVAAGLPQILDR
jgi:pimeloyl-ACP methyl ester carboxylesterase